nr:hypothetical protein [uncultured Niameybacter sp.]
MLKAKLIGVFRVLLWIFQFLILLCSFLAVTSTIKFFPWYEPLTMGALFAILFLIPIQVLLIPIYFIRYRPLLFEDIVKAVPLLNSGLLLLIFLFVVIYEPSFYLVCGISAILEVLLIVSWIKIFLKKCKG